jgi:hypothetical protein
MMDTALWVVIIFLTEFAQSFFADQRTVMIVSRRRTKAVVFDVVAEGLGWLAIVLIIINRLYPLYIISAVLGNALGTWLVAGRKLRKKKVVVRNHKKKLPVMVSTA